MIDEAGGRRVDFGRHSEDYATFRPGPPPAFYDRLDALAPLRGARALDLGTGPGTIALELAARGASVVGLDVAPEQVAAAEAVAAERGLGGAASFVVASAERTGLEHGSFDLVTAGQCWHWFDPDRALAEVRRLLRPGGALAIVAYSYLAEHSTVARDSEALVLELHPSWDMAGWTGVFPGQIDEVIHGGLELVEAFCFDHDEPFSHARWRGRMRTCNGVGSGGLPPEGVARYDRALEDLLRRKYPDPFTVPHRVWCVVARQPAGAG